MKTIPLVGGSANAHQTFTVQLGDNLLDFELNYQQSGQWAVNIEREGVRLVNGAMIEPGADIIEAWNLSDDVGYLYVVGDDTTLDNLGINNTLVWVALGEQI